MGFQDVAFLPSRANFSTTFVKICGRDEVLRTVTYLTPVVVVSKSMFPVKYFCEDLW